MIENINGPELKNWIRTNYASQVAPKSFAGMMIQAITDRIDQMLREANNTTPVQTKMGITTGELVEEEEEDEDEEESDPMITNTIETKKEFRKWKHNKKRR